MSKQSIKSFLSYLAFEGYALRIGIEISLTIIAHSIVFQLLLLFSKSPASAGMISWFFCCGTIMLLDKIILGQPADIFRQAYLCSLHGSFEKALELLNSIGPESASLIKLPQSQYQLHRAELLTKCRDFSAANLAFELAEDADPERLAILKYRYFIEMNKHEEAEKFIQESFIVNGQTPSLLLDYGRNQLHQKKFWDAAKTFKLTLEVCAKNKMNASIHSNVALAYLGICKLKTGHAEEGLELLENVVQQIQAEMSFSDSLRPTLAEILVFRSHYLATHRAPKEAVLDLKYALSICSFTHLTEIVKEVKEELALRYGLKAL